MSELNGKVALVTGASRGIGRAIAMALANAGARVLVHYGRSRQEAQDVASSILASQGKADVLGADLSTPDGPPRVAEQVRELTGGALDIVVLNAGISKAAPLAAYKASDLDSLFQTNVRGPFLLLQQLVPLLRTGAAVVAVTSVVARAVVGAPALDEPSILAYASTKGALETLVKNWAVILGLRGIRVNAVAPGVIDTDMSNFTKTEAGRTTALAMQALKRIGRPEDVADVVTFLVSERARWITGASVPVDGGSKL